MTQYVKAKSLSISMDTSYFKTCKLTLQDLTIEEGVPEEGKQLRVDYINGTEVMKIFKGVIDSKDLSQLSPASDKLTVNVSSNGFRTVPYRRTITETFDIDESAPTDIDGYQYITGAYIIGHLVNMYLSVEGITFDNITAFEGKRYIDTQQYTCQTIGDILDQLARDSFGNWYIDINKNLCFVKDYATQIGLDTADLDVSAYGGILIDFRNPKLKTALESYANKVFFRGDLDDNLDDIQVSAQDDDEIAHMASLDNGSGVYGISVENANIKTIAEAQEYCQKILDKRKSKPKSLEFDTLDWVNFSVGNIQNVHIPILGITNTDERPPNYIVESMTLTDMGVGILTKHIVMRQLFPTGNGGYTWSKSSQGVAFFRALTNEAKKTPDRIKNALENHLYVEKLRGNILSTQNFNGDGDYIQLEKQFMTFWDASAPSAPKMALGFVDGLSAGIPGIVLGAGDGNGNYRGYIQKDTNGFELIYKYGVNVSDVSGIKFDNYGNILINDNIVPPLTDLVLQGEYSSAADAWNAKLSQMKYDGSKYAGGVTKSLTETDTYLEVGGAYSDLSLYWGGYSSSIPYFQIYNQANGGLTIKSYGADILNYGWDDTVSFKQTAPQGTWDFQYANVTNLSATAKFA